MYIVIYSRLPHCISMKYILKSQPHCFIDVVNATQFAHHHDDWPHRCARVVQAYALRSVLERFTNYDWFLWLDCDVIITDVTQTVESILASLLGEATESFPTEPSPLGLQPVVMRNFRFMYMYACCFLKNMERFQLRCHCILPMKWIQNTNDVLFFLGALEAKHHWSVQVMQPLNCPWCWSVQIDGGSNLIWFCLEVVTFWRGARNFYRPLDQKTA